MATKAFAALLESEIRGSFFLRQQLEEHLVSGQAEDFAHELNLELAAINAKVGKTFTPIFTFEVIKGRHKNLDDLRMWINDRDGKGKLVQVGNLDFRHILVQAGHTQYSALFFDRLLQTA